jgi:hypothetical protein
MVSEYLDTRPDPGAYDFLRFDFDSLEKRYSGVLGTSFSTFPSYPRRFIEPLAAQPAFDESLINASVEPLRTSQTRALYTDEDLDVRQFLRSRSRPLVRKDRVKAA